MVQYYLAGRICLLQSVRVVFLLRAGENTLALRVSLGIGPQWEPSCAGNVEQPKKQQAGLRKDLAEQIVRSQKLE